MNDDEPMTRDDMEALKRQIKALPPGFERAVAESLIDGALLSGIDTVLSQAKAFGARDMYERLAQYSPGEKAQ